MKRHLRALVGLGALLLAAPLGAACQRHESSAAPLPADALPSQAAQGAPQTPSKPLPSVKPLAAKVHRGVCYAHNWQHGGSKGYGSEASLQSKRELAALGVDWVSITPFGFQESLQSTEVQSSGRAMAAGENDDRLERETQQAHELGMKVMLKPHLWISHSEWQGHIQPAGPDGWDKWFASYQKFILHYAALAERLKIDAFVVGVEMPSSSWTQRDHWVKTIAMIREVYHGPLAYAANWNEAEKVTFWDKIDWIGVQLYTPLTTRLDASYDELAAALDKDLDNYEALSKKYGKPVFLTEVGYKSIRATAVSPHTWPEHLPPESKAYDEGAQSLAYRAMLNRVAERDFIQGVYVWKWFTDVDTDEEGTLGFSPRKKQAAQVLGQAYARPQ